MTTREPAIETPSPVRWLIPLALFVTTFINWLDRQALSYALPTIAKEHGLSTAEEIGANFASLVPSFFLGYGLSNIFLSSLAERFGPTEAEIARPLTELPDPPNEALLKGESRLVGAGR